jgi:hypothetical protein
VVDLVAGFGSVAVVVGASTEADTVVVLLVEELVVGAEVGVVSARVLVVSTSAVAMGRVAAEVGASPTIATSGTVFVVELGARAFEVVAV